MEMTVTGIEPYPKGKGRVSIYLNDKFAFVLYKGELSQYGLEIGNTGDDELYEKILSETRILRAKKRGMNLLLKNDRTEADVRGKLSEGGYPPEAVDAAIEYLKSFRYLDDMRYACEYIRCKSETTSRKMIVKKLSDKGIDRDTVEAAFNSFEEESDTSTQDSERELIRRLIVRRCPQGVGELDYNGRQKLYAYLYGKGFSIPDIEKVVNDLTSGDF